MAVNDFMETRLMGLSDYFRVGTGAPTAVYYSHTVDYTLVLESSSSYRAADLVAACLSRGMSGIFADICSSARNGRCG